jgi:glycosyltransferase involved in cell wall biosynthesis
MDYRPNVDAALWFANDIFPQISDAHLYLVGNRPGAQLQALGGNITVTGFVDEVLPYLHAATVFVVPMRVGSGTRLKLLQAMAAGCAIVSTRTGAAGLNVTHGREMLLADDAASFARAVNSLLKDEDRRAELAANGKNFVREHFDWSVIVPKLLRVYEGR